MFFNLPRKATKVFIILFLYEVRLGRAPLPARPPAHARLRKTRGRGGYPSCLLELLYCTCHLLLLFLLLFASHSLVFFFPSSRYFFLPFFSLFLFALYFFSGLRLPSSIHSSSFLISVFVLSIQCSLRPPFSFFSLSPLLFVLPISSSHCSSYFL